MSHKRPHYIRTDKHAVDRPLVYAVAGGWGYWDVFLGTECLGAYDTHPEALAFAIRESGQ